MADRNDTRSSMKDVLVDSEDAGLLNGYRWHINNRGYVVRTEIAARKGRMLVILHRIIAGADEGQVVDHINGNKLDNRRSNLRACSVAENLRNRKMHKNNACGMKGVYMDPRLQARPFAAQIRFDGKKIRLGQYATAEEAASAYREAAVKYHGAFANATGK